MRHPRVESSRERWSTAFRTENSRSSKPASSGKEKKLLKNAAHISAKTGLLVLRPPDPWAMLKPWAALFY